VAGGAGGRGEDAEADEVKVLCFQVDGKFPNLALMRLCSWHRAKGDSVFLTPFLRDLPFIEASRVYASSIFTFSGERRKQFGAHFPEAICGGDGYKPIWNDLTIIGRNVGTNLREIIQDCDPETIVPDYSDYPTFMASIGYTQRGCRLDCAFCRMKTREGEARGVNTLHGIWRGGPWPKHIVLLDNDFFGQAEWRERLEEAKAGAFKVCFNQGINIRLIGHEQARELAGVFYCDDQFKVRRLYTAWDNLGDERIFKEGVRSIVDAGIPAKHLMVYMLIGFRKGETEEEILHRLHEIEALGCNPYPMVFDRSNARLRAFQRWVLRGFSQRRKSRNNQPLVPWDKYGEIPPMEKQASLQAQLPL
jgi:hypothetical protein